jgi:hypothetical protein
MEIPAFLPPSSNLEFGANTNFWKENIDFPSRIYSLTGSALLLRSFCTFAGWNPTIFEVFMFILVFLACRRRRQAWNPAVEHEMLSFDRKILELGFWKRKLRESLWHLWPN